MIPAKVHPRTYERAMEGLDEAHLEILKALDDIRYQSAGDIARKLPRRLRVVSGARGVQGKLLQLRNRHLVTRARGSAPSAFLISDRGVVVKLMLQERLDAGLLR